ncbi:MAG: phosphoglycerate dehydrogenase [Thermomicrobiaceae bacterium]
MSKEILVISSKFRESSETYRALLEREGCTLAERNIQYPITEDHLADIIKDADGLITGLEPVTPRVLQNANRLKVISAGGVGYDHIDVEAATERGIAVCNCAGCNNRSVAELAFGMMLSLSRQIFQSDRAMRNGEWARFTGPELWGKTIGIIGLGRVGKSVSQLAKGFGMRILATDVAWDITYADEHGISYVPLDRLLRESDYVTVHTPLTPWTHNMIDERAIELMKPSAYLINTARGPIVKEEALCDALKKNRIAGAGLDVFKVEPTNDCAFVEFDNVIITPHIGGASNEAYDRSLQLALLNVTSVLNGRAPHSQVNDFS